MGRRNFAGLSMMEILISMMILALVLVGLANVFMASRGFMAHSRFRTTASQLATVLFDPLQNEVNDSSWDAPGNLLNVGTRTCSTFIDGVTYNPAYNITVESGTTFLRRVVVNITWNETKF
jgi:Tfp pilus assembly protein PilV